MTYSDTGMRSLARGVRRAFTLVEVLLAVTVGLVFLTMLLGVAAMSMRMVYKSVSLNDATSSTRLVQEYLSREISQAVRVPDFHNESGPGSNQYSEIRYRILVGPTAKVVGTTLRTSTTVVLSCPAELQPKAGDFLMITTPNLGENGARIVHVEDSRGVGVAGNVTVTLTDSIETLTQAGSLKSDLKGDINLAFQRERCFRVNPPDPDSVVSTLEWLETTLSYATPVGGGPATSFDPPGIVICTKVDAAKRFLFSREPAVPTATEEPGLIWQMNYLSDKSSTLIGQLVGGMKGAYMAAHTEGLIMPKSNNPLGTGGIIVSTKCTSTSTTSTTSTTSKTTSTTSKSTTSTTKTTTTKTTSTSKTTTTKTTTTKTTTTKTTSIKTTSTSSISTSSVSTTSKSTTTTKPTTTTTTTSIIDG